MPGSEIKITIGVELDQEDLQRQIQELRQQLLETRLKIPVTLETEEGGSGSGQPRQSESQRSEPQNSSGSASLFEGVIGSFQEAVEALDSISSSISSTAGEFSSLPGALKGIIPSFDAKDISKIVSDAIKSSFSERREPSVAQKDECCEKEPPAEPKPPVVEVEVLGEFDPDPFTAGLSNLKSANQAGFDSIRVAINTTNNALIDVITSLEDGIFSEILDAVSFDGFRNIIESAFGSVTTELTRDLGKFLFKSARQGIAVAAAPADRQSQIDAFNSVEDGSLETKLITGLNNLQKELVRNTQAISGTEPLALQLKRLAITSAKQGAINFAGQKIKQLAPGLNIPTTTQLANPGEIKNLISAIQTLVKTLISTSKKTGEKAKATASQLQIAGSTQLLLPSAAEVARPEENTAPNPPPVIEVPPSPQSEPLQNLQTVDALSANFREIFDQVLKLSGFSERDAAAIDPSAIPFLAVDRENRLGGASSYNAARNEITLNPKIAQALMSGRVTKRDLKVLVHEMRHALQFGLGTKSLGELSSGLSAGSKGFELPALRDNPEADRSTFRRLTDLDLESIPASKARAVKEQVSNSTKAFTDDQRSSGNRPSPKLQESVRQLELDAELFATEAIEQLWRSQLGALQKTKRTPKKEPPADPLAVNLFSTDQGGTDYQAEVAKQINAFKQAFTEAANTIKGFAGSAAEQAKTNAPKSVQEARERFEARAQQVKEEAKKRAPEVQEQIKNFAQQTSQAVRNTVENKEEILSPANLKAIGLNFLNQLKSFVVNQVINRIKGIGDFFLNQLNKFPLGLQKVLLGGLKSIVPTLTSLALPLAGLGAAAVATNAINGRPYPELSRPTLFSTDEGGITPDPWEDFPDIPLPADPRTFARENPELERRELDNGVGQVRASVDGIDFGLRMTLDEAQRELPQAIDRTFRSFITNLIKAIPVRQLVAVSSGLILASKGLGLFSKIGGVFSAITGAREISRVQRGKKEESSLSRLPRQLLNPLLLFGVGRQVGGASNLNNRSQRQEQGRDVNSALVAASEGNISGALTGIAKSVAIAAGIGKTISNVVVSGLGPGGILAGLAGFGAQALDRGVARNQGTDVASVGTRNLARGFGDSLAESIKSVPLALQALLTGVDARNTLDAISPRDPAPTPTGLRALLANTNQAFIKLTNPLRVLGEGFKAFKSAGRAGVGLGGRLAAGAATVGGTIVAQNIGQNGLAGTTGAPFPGLGLLQNLINTRIGRNIAGAGIGQAASGQLRELGLGAGASGLVGTVVGNLAKQLLAKISEGRPEQSRQRLQGLGIVVTEIIKIAKVIREQLVNVFKGIGDSIQSLIGNNPLFSTEAVNESNIDEVLTNPSSERLFSTEQQLGLGATIRTAIEAVVEQIKVAALKLKDFLLSLFDFPQPTPPQEPPQPDPSEFYGPPAPGQQAAVDPLEFYGPPAPSAPQQEASPEAAQVLFSTDGGGQGGGLGQLLSDAFTGGAVDGGTLENTLGSIFARAANAVGDALPGGEQRRQQREQAESLSVGQRVELLLENVFSRVGDRLTRSGLSQEDQDALSGQAAGYVGSVAITAAPLATIAGLAAPVVAAFGPFIGAIKLISERLKPLAETLARTLQVISPLQTRFATVGGSALKGRQLQDFAVKVSDDLNTPLLSSLEGFSQIAAATKGTSLEGDKLKDLFTGISQAVAALGLSAEDTKLVLLGFQQVISKGKIQAEELRGQIGERLPGAVKLFADALGVTEAQLNGMLERGELLAADVLPKVAAQLTKVYGEGARQSVGGFIAGLNKIENGVLKLQLALVDAFGPLLSATTNLAGNLVTAFAGVLPKLQGLINNLILGISATILAGTVFLATQLNIGGVILGAVTPVYAALFAKLTPFVYGLLVDSLGDGIGALTGIDFRNQIDLAITGFSNITIAGLQTATAIKDNFGGIGAIASRSFDAVRRSFSILTDSIINKSKGLARIVSPAFSSAALALEKIPKGASNSVPESTTEEEAPGSFLGLDLKSVKSFGVGLTKLTLELFGLFLLLSQTAVLIQILGQGFAKSLGFLKALTAATGSQLVAQRGLGQLFVNTTAGLSGYALALGILATALVFIAANTDIFNARLGKSINQLKNLATNLDTAIEGLSRTPVGEIPSIAPPDTSELEKFGKKGIDLLFGAGKAFGIGDPITGKFTTDDLIIAESQNRQDRLTRPIIGQLEVDTAALGSIDFKPLIDAGAVDQGLVSDALNGNLSAIAQLEERLQQVSRAINLSSGELSRLPEGVRGQLTAIRDVVAQNVGDEGFSAFSDSLLDASGAVNKFKDSLLEEQASFQDPGLFNLSELTDAFSLIGLRSRVVETNASEGIDRLLGELDKQGVSGELLDLFKNTLRSGDIGQIQSLLDSIEIGREVTPVEGTPVPLPFATPSVSQSPLGSRPSSFTEPLPFVTPSVPQSPLGSRPSSFIEVDGIRQEIKSRSDLRISILLLKRTIDSANRIATTLKAPTKQEAADLIQQLALEGVLTSAQSDALQAAGPKQAQGIIADIKNQDGKSNFQGLQEQLQAEGKSRAQIEATIGALADLETLINAIETNTPTERLDTVARFTTLQQANIIEEQFRKIQALINESGLTPIADPNVGLEQFLKNSAGNQSAIEILELQDINAQIRDKAQERADIQRELSTSPNLDAERVQALTERSDELDGELGLLEGARGKLGENIKAIVEIRDELELLVASQIKGIKEDVKQGKETPFAGDLLIESLEQNFKDIFPQLDAIAEELAEGFANSFESEFNEAQKIINASAKAFETNRTNIEKRAREDSGVLAIQQREFAESALPQGFAGPNRTTTAAVQSVEQAKIDVDEIERQRGNALTNFLTTQDELAKAEAAAANAPGLSNLEEKLADVRAKATEAQQAYYDAEISYTQKLNTLRDQQIALVKALLDDQRALQRIDFADLEIGLREQRLRGLITQVEFDRGLDAERVIDFRVQLSLNKQEQAEIEKLFRTGAIDVLTYNQELRRLKEEYQGLDIARLTEEQRIFNDELNRQVDTLAKLSDLASKRLDFKIAGVENAKQTLSAITEQLSKQATFLSKQLELVKANNTANKEALDVAGKITSNSKQKDKEEAESEAPVSPIGKVERDIKAGQALRLDPLTAGIIPSFTTERELAEQGIAVRAEALAAEQEGARRLLTIEKQREEVAARIAVKEAEIGRLKAEQAIVQARANLQRSISEGAIGGFSPEALAAIQSAAIDLQISEQSLELAKDQLAISLEGVGLQAELSSIDRKALEKNQQIERISLIGETAIDDQVGVGAFNRLLNTLSRSTSRTDSSGETGFPTIDLDAVGQSVGLSSEIIQQIKDRLDGGLSAGNPLLSTGDDGSIVLPEQFKLSEINQRSADTLEQILLVLGTLINPLLEQINSGAPADSLQLRDLPAPFVISTAGVVPPETIDPSRPDWLDPTSSFPGVIEGGGLTPRYQPPTDSMQELGEAIQSLGSRLALPSVSLEQGAARLPGYLIDSLSPRGDTEVSYRPPQDFGNNYREPKYITINIENKIDANSQKAMFDKIASAQYTAVVSALGNI